MATLLLEKDLRNSEEDSEVRAIAQAQTLTTLRKMDAQGKRTVVLFLRDAGLLQRPSFDGGREPVIRLADADLSGADLSFAYLSGADLSDARGVTDEQLDRAASLEGATMPNGSKHP